MKQKLLFFFLTAFLSLIGGGELWAQTTVGYTEAIDVTTKTLQARSLSNGGLDHLTISEPIKGTSIGDYPSTSTGVYVGSTQYTSTNSWRKSENTSEYSPNQYVGYTLTVDDGYRLNISKVAAKILVADDTYTWKVEIENSSGTKIYTSADSLKADKTSQDALADNVADNVSLSHLEGTVTVKLYMYQGGKTKYFCINYLELDVTVEEDPRATLTVFDKEGTWPSPFGFVEDVASSKQKTLMFKFNEASSLKPLTKVDPTKLSVTSDNTGVFTIGSYTVGVNGSGNRERINIPIQVVSEGTANVVVSFAGDDNFKPHDAVSIPITTKNIKLETYSSYPFTWDFANNDWESSKIQMAANSTDWASYSGEGRSKQSSVSATSGIDMIEGLAFSGLTADDGTSSNGTLCLDWTNKAVWLNGTVTLPALLRGHTVKIASNAVPTAVAAGLTRMTSEETAGVYVYRATAAVASPTFTFSGSHISSIEVSRTTIQLIYDNEDTKGCLKGATPTLTLGTSDNWGNYAFNVIPGIDNTEYTATSLPSGILDVRYKDGKYMANNGGYNYLTLTGTTTGTAHITVTISPVGEHAFDIVGPYEFDVRVVQNAVPTKWEFENTGKWTTATAAALGADGTNWQSGTAANEYKNKNKINGTELYVGETKMKETAGLYITAEKGAIQVNPTNGYVRIGNASRANIVIPNAVAEQTVTFKVKTATAGKDCGIQAASSNLALISGCVAGDVSYYTFRVTSNGDIKFTQTSSDTDLFIYYIDLKAATPANTGLKFVHGSDDISNTKVNIVSGVTGALDSYFTLAQGGSVNWANVTVAVSPSSLITYDNDGTFTMGSGTGTATIKARTIDSSVETGIAVLYVSVKAQPTVTLSANGPFSVNYGQDFNNNTSTVTGTSNPSLPVLYKSSNERVATVNASGKVTCKGVGSVVITAYTEETDDYLPAEASYQLTYNAGEVIFQFEPSEVKLALGKNITPFLHYDQDGQLDANTLEYSVSKSDVLDCEVVTDPQQSDKNLIKITSLDDASKIGETVIVTASATMKNSSVVYNTTIAVTITAADAVNFDWVNGDDIYVYENTYFPIPGYNGNASGNNHFSNGSANASTHKAYLYVKNGGGNPVWNTQNYKLNEGVPDYFVDDTDKALIFWAHSDKSNYPDTLLVYAKTAGTVTLHAKDSQTGVECTPITIHILAKSGQETAHTAEVNTISLPYTWDFTKNFSESDFANSMFWEEDGSGRYNNTSVWMNQDWAYELGGSRFPVNFLGGTGAGSPIALFKGAQIQLGNSTYNSKIGRLQVRPNAGEGNSHLSIIGGQHFLYLPEIPVERTPNQAYRLYVKAKGQSTKYNSDGSRNDDNCSRIIVEVDNGSGGYTNLGKLVYAEETKGQENYIVKCLYCDIPAASAGKTLRLNFDKNVELHWIALSTEAKAVNKPTDKNLNLSYAASSYAYKKALDLSKSEEANEGLEVYYASGFKKGSNASASPGSDGSAVVLTRMTTDGKPVVEANTGLILKAANAFDSYMIAHAENAESPVTPSVFTGEGAPTNYLVAGPGATVNSSEGAGDAIKTNFVISYAYKKFTENTSSAVSDYLYDRDWSFYKIIPSVNVPSSSAYLSIPGNLYVNEEGEIVERATSARAAFGVESAADDDTAEAPASKLMLDIIFQETSNTATDDPATEDPESPLPPDVINGIDNVKTDEADKAVWHSMEGVRISQPTKPGLYIRNGKKVVIK